LKLWITAFAAGMLIVGVAFGAPQAHAQAAPFADTPTNHWAYDAVQDLAKRGIVIGYPDGTYGGKRPMTRYEFAVAVDRALRTIDDMVKAAQTNTPPPAGTPPATNLTQEQLNEVQALIDKFRPELDTIQSNLKQAQDDIDALRADVLDAKALAAKAQDTANNSYGVGANRKFQISGYVQARYSTIPSGQGGLDRFPQGTTTKSGVYNGSYGSGGNPASFQLRRSRLKFTGAVTSNTRYGIQIDASGASSIANTPVATPTGGTTNNTTLNQQVTVREGYVAYTFGNGDQSKNITMTAGQFATPFGYQLPASTSNILTPERPLAFNENGEGLFNSQDYDKGIQFGYNTQQQLLFLPAGLKFTAALVNGSGRTSDNTDRFADQVYRIGYQTPDKVFSVGGSYYYGQVNVPATLPGGPAAGTGSTYTGRKKELYGADAQIVLPSGPFLNAEYVGGLYEQRSYFNSAAATGLTTTYAKDNKVDGYYVQGGFTFGPTGTHPLTLAANYDVLKRGEGPGGSDTYTDKNLGYGALYGLDKATRLRVWYTRPDRVAYTGAVTPPRYGLLIGEVQVKF